MGLMAVGALGEALDSAGHIFLGGHICCPNYPETGSLMSEFNKKQHTCDITHPAPQGKPSFNCLS